jgi:hypothetical protein
MTYYRVRPFTTPVSAMAYVTASAATRSDSPFGAWSANADATTSGATDGRPRVEGNRSANIPGGNSSNRCSARNENTLPAGRRCPATGLFCSLLVRVVVDSFSRCGPLAGWGNACRDPVVIPP